MEAPSATPHPARCGSWKSPITADFIARGLVGLGQLAWDEENVFFTEMRPGDKGRMVLVRRNAEGALEDVTPPDFHVRTRVHEYGGGDYLVRAGTVYFSNFDDQRVYRQDPGRAPRPITPAIPLRFADYQLDQARDTLVCVREDKRRAGSQEDVNTIVSIAIGGDDEGGRVLASGRDFYASPRLSPDGSRLAWLAWDHPNMPWDAAELWIATFAKDGTLEDPVRVAGGPSESIFQPAWGEDGTLYFVSDRTNFWNLYRWREGACEAVCPREAEFGLPQWVFGQSTYAFVGPSLALCTFVEKGLFRLALLDVTTGKLDVVASPYTWFASLRGAPGRAIFVAGSPTEPSAVVGFDVASRSFDVLRRCTDVRFDAAYVSPGEAIEFPTEGGKTAHAFFYRPANRDFQPLPGEKPPLLVKAHSGPTSAANNVFALGIQYWTSRGFAVLDVNYGGSTGFGRLYRNRLRGQWGVVDVDDCVNGARFLVERGEVDADRLVISGGSAGGYTVLSALTFRSVFKAGASHYGISNLERLAHDARFGNHHKFESRYEDGLVAPYPEQVGVYRERSPIFHTDRLSCPIIFFQGMNDTVVLPNQAEQMVATLREKKLPVAYVPFEGEGHGFRQAANIRRVFDAELYFYSRVFQFRTADPIEPVPIDNL